MKLWSIDVRLYATAYIKAETQEEAMNIARTLSGESPGILNSGGDVPLSDLQFSDNDLPDVSLSPAMTIAGPDDDSVPQIAVESI